MGSRLVSSIDVLKLTFPRPRLKAHRRMFVLFDEIRRENGLRANVVALIEHSYGRIRDETGLPAGLVTLGICDFAQPISGLDPEAATSIPLDDKPFSVKGASEITLATL